MTPTRIQRRRAKGDCPECGQFWYHEVTCSANVERAAREV